MIELAFAIAIGIILSVAIPFTFCVVCVFLTKLIKHFIYDLDK